MFRKRLSRLFLATAAASLLGATPAFAQASAPTSSNRPVFLAAALSGSQEVQVAGKPRVGAPNGRATVEIEVTGDQVLYAFRWSGISAPTEGHIHEGIKGVNGDVVVPLFTTKMPDSATAAAGAVTVTDPAVATALRKNPAGFYANLHTKEFPGGAVRGQLIRVDQPLNLLAIVQNQPLRAFMSGDQEVPVAGKPAVGDPGGRAVAFLRVGTRQVDYSFAWVGVTPTLGHIHKGVFGVNGPVVVPLITTPVPSGVFALSGTVSNLDPGLLTSIRNNPNDFYTNLHTRAFPGGAVRGQLF